MEVFTELIISYMSFLEILIILSEKGTTKATKV